VTVAEPQNHTSQFAAGTWQQSLFLGSRLEAHGLQPVLVCASSSLNRLAALAAKPNWRIAVMLRSRRENVA
jgi:hypothetical protein